MNRRAFSLVELLAVVGVISVLAGLIVPSLAGAFRKARAAEELSAARQLLVAATLYSGDHAEALFPGYAAGGHVRDDLGKPVSFPENARYPWRIAPYVGHSFATLYSGRNRRRLDALKRLDRAGYVYGVSVYPSLGINSWFVGGHESEFPAHQANARFGAGTVPTRIPEVRNPAHLIHFVSARSAVSGIAADGYFHVTPPATSRLRWTPGDWDPSLPPEARGFTAPRHGGRAVTAMIDGHAELVGWRELPDMTRWSNTADRPDQRLLPQPISP